MPHIHEKIDFTVSVFIEYHNKVLIRKHDKYGIWMGVGGHIELDEQPNQTALREVKEEVGLDVTLWKPSHVQLVSEDGIKSLIPPFFLNIHQINEIHQHVDLIYFATSTSDTVIPEKPTDEWKWLTLEEVRQNPEISKMVKSYVEYLFSVKPY